MTKATQQCVFFAVAVSQNETLLLILIALLLKQVLSDTEACVVFTEVRIVLFISLTMKTNDRSNIFLLTCTLPLSRPVVNQIYTPTGL